MKTASTLSTARVTPRLGGDALLRGLLPLVMLLAFTGYVGPWVNHQTAGLVITGLDLGEYVKFLAPVRSGEVTLWREGFYLPLVAVSLAASLLAYRRELRYRWPVRALLLTLAVVAALNLLPPAWTPHRMLTPEFRQQALALALVLTAVAFSPFLALLPRRVTAVLVALVGLIAAVIPPRQFFAILPEISQLYNKPQTAGWGMLLCIVSLLALAGFSAWFGWRRQPLTSE
jgi:hypothetical protein